MKLTYLLFTCVIVSIAACTKDVGIEEIEVTYDTVPFDRIRLETSSAIRIIQSNLYQVVVRGEKRDFDDTDVRVINGRLTIEEHGLIDEEQVIRIYVPEIRDLEVFGSSPVYGESEFIQNTNMDMSLTGSGEIDMYLDIGHLDIELTGSGEIYLEGLANQVDGVITGSGWIRSFLLHSDFTDIRVTGSGSAEVTVDANLDVVITGSGDVYYKGDPHIYAQITGSGRLIDAN